MCHILYTIPNIMLHFNLLFNRLLWNEYCYGLYLLNRSRYRRIYITPVLYIIVLKFVIICQLQISTILTHKVHCTLDTIIRLKSVSKISNLLPVLFQKNILKARNISRFLYLSTSRHAYILFSKSSH